MTLSAHATVDSQLFESALRKYFGGELESFDARAPVVVPRRARCDDALDGKNDPAERDRPLCTRCGKVPGLGLRRRQCPHAGSHLSMCRHAGCDHTALLTIIIKGVNAFSQP